MTITRIEIINSYQLRITEANNQQSIIEDIILDIGNNLIRFTFTLNKLSFFTMESLVYVQAPFYSSTAIINRVDLHKDIGGQIISSEFTNAEVDFYCIEEVYENAVNAR
ncbi:hypothetical protein C900_01707 [Fulvivirga imtechensis AK7]|uniref:Uncharacterized protein n=1 Tax=Fulvivirga imtechensis AK7 TaxID=1237149 RepID=L8JYM1_9BACT|nr:hypothetical protein [Fulvivirga imtechensis]ELR72292.1 hypothetical protein C900_01707 [Fulvivirga imtechensis AK7]